MRSIKIFIWISLALTLLATAQSCVREKFIVDEGAGVEFSEDTVRFDTVFTQLGSATRFFKVYNPHSLPIIIDQVVLASGDNSRFRFNIDGYQGPVAEGIEIGAGDSTYVFLEVTINPDLPLSVSPFVIEERIQFRVNGQTQEVNLEAWGQNANYIPSRFGKNGVALLSCDFDRIVWNDPKPYVIYGILVVDECTLVWPEGTQIYVHGGIARSTDLGGGTFFYNDGLIFIAASGTLQSEGTVDDPVIVQGDRLEPFFAGLPGQWQGIRLDKGSTGNRFEHTVIRNGLYGVFVDSSASLTLKGTQIYNTSTDGLLSFHGNISAENCLIFNNGRNSFSAILGGNYDFSYCTLANFGNDQPAVGITGGYCYDFPECNVYKELPTKATFRNCIMTGSNADEFWMIRPEMENLDVQLDHCLIRVNELLDTRNFPDFFAEYTVNCLNRRRTDSLFADRAMDNYRPDTLSVLEGKATPLTGILKDLDGNDRDPVMPDIGCFEYQY